MGLRAEFANRIEHDHGPMGVHYHWTSSEGLTRPSKSGDYSPARPGWTVRKIVSARPSPKDRPEL